MSTAKSEITAASRSWRPDHHRQHHQLSSDDSGNFTGSMFTEGDGSHVTMLSPRRDPASSVAEMTEDGCHTSAVSLSEYLTAPSTPRNPSATAESGESYLKAIFDNFNELYHDKMAWIDENIPGGDTPAHVMAKKNVLEHWVKDVIEQNNILVQTVEELEAEAERKVQNLQKKVQDAAEVAKEHMNMIKEYEEQIKHLIKEKNIVEKQEEFFRKESMYLEKEKRRALDRLHTLETDNASLCVLINRIRDMGVWDINGLEFAPRTYDSIFGLYPNLPGSEVQTVFTREKSRNLEKAENSVAQLKAQMEELHDRKNEAERLLTEKTKITEDLQNDIKELHMKIKQYQDEHQEFKKSLKETQEQLKAATVKNSRPSTADAKREAEMKKMLAELKDLRNQLTVACNERQQAMKESNALKTDLKGRISQMEEMKQLLEQLQTESASTRNAVQHVQDKQDQMSSLKEKVNFYQANYENSNVLLEAKSEVIVKLQNQMEQLHDKVTRLEQSRSCSPSPAAAVVMPHSRSLSPTPPTRRTSRPGSHPASRPASQPSAHHAPAVSASPGTKKSKGKDSVKKPTVKVKKITVVPKPSKNTELKSHSQELKKHASISSYSKPPWNDHFVRSAKKPVSPRPTSDKAKSYPSGRYTSDIKSGGTTKHSKLEVSGSGISTFLSDKMDEKRGYTDVSKGATDGSHPTVNRIIADYLGQSDSGKMSTTTDKTASKRVSERVKLPPIPTKSDTTTSPHPSPSKAYEKSTEEHHLPRIIVKEKKSHTSHNIETLENLMEVCVKASRELNKPSGDGEGKTTPKYRVVAGHSHRRRNHRSRENTYTVEAVPKSKTTKSENLPASTKKAQEGRALEDKPSKGKSSTRLKDSSNKNKAKKESETESLSDISQFRRVAVHPPPIEVASNTLAAAEEKSPEKILAELPKVSLDYLVKKWIVSSPTPSKKLRKPRSSSPDKTSSKHHHHYHHTHRSKYPSELTTSGRPESPRGKSKSSGPVNLKFLTTDEGVRRQHNHHHQQQQQNTETTHSDATGDRDSGHLSDFSDWWNWNGNDDESVIDKEVQLNSSELGILSEQSTYESLGSPHREMEKIQQLLAENQRLKEQNSKLEQMNESIRVEKEVTEEVHKKEMEKKDVEITMQKLPPNSGDGMGILLMEENNYLEREISHVERACANFQSQVTRSSTELAGLKSMSRQFCQDVKVLEKDHLLYRSYSLLKQLEEQREEYVGDCPGNAAVEKCSGAAGMADKILEALKRLEEAALFLQDRVTGSVGTVEKMGEEFQTIKHKVEFMTSNFRQIILEAHKENSRLLGVVEKLEKKQAQIDEFLAMESEIHGMQDEVSSDPDLGALLTEKRLGLIQQSYDRLSQELLRRDELISQRDSKIAELENYIRESETLNVSRDSSRNVTELEISLQNEAASPCPDSENIRKLLWLVGSLRKKLKKKKEREAALLQEKQLVLRLASAITSTWENVRSTYDQIQAESADAKSKCDGAGHSSTVFHSNGVRAYIEAGGGDERGRGPFVAPSFPYANSASGTAIFEPQHQDSYHGSVGITSISSSGNLNGAESVQILAAPPAMQIMEGAQNFTDATLPSSSSTQMNDLSIHDPDNCIYLQNIVKALEECHNRIKQEVAMHS